MSKDMDFLSFARNLSNKYGKQLLDTATKTAIESLKTASKKVVHKVTDEFVGSKIADKVVTLKPVSDENLGDVEE